MATDSTGGTLIARAEISSGGTVPIGFIKTTGDAIFIPYLSQAYDGWLFSTAALADANDTTNAIRLADDVAFLSNISSPDNTQEYEFTSTIGTTSHPGIITGYTIRTNYFDSNRTLGSGAEFSYTGTTTAGKAGNVPDADGYFYDSDGKQFAVIQNSGVNIKWFGAYAADAGAVNVLAIQYAINYMFALGGGDVFVPSGNTFIVDASNATSSVPVIAMKNGVCLRGRGKIKVKDNTVPVGQPAIIGNDQTDGTTDIHVKHVTIDANDTNNTNKSSSIHYGRPLAGGVGCTDSSIKGTRCLDSSNIAIAARDGCDNCQIVGNRTKGGAYGIQSAQSLDVLIDGNTVQGTDSENGIDVEGNDGTTGPSDWTGVISSNIVKNTAKTGIFIETSSYVTCVGNRISSPTQWGIFLNRINSITRGDVINSNIVEGGTSGCIGVSGVIEDYTITDNSLEGGTYGVWLSGGYYGKVNDNTIYNSTTAVYLEGLGERTKVFDNTFRGCTNGINNASATQTKIRYEDNEYKSVTTPFQSTSTEFTYKSIEDDTVQEYLADPSAVTVDLNKGNIVRVLIGANPITLGAPSHSNGYIPKGQKLHILIEQGATGRSVTFNAVYKLKTAASTVANEKSHYTFMWDGTDWEDVSEVVGF
jgi:hypothetical protein